MLALKLDAVLRSEKLAPSTSLSSLAAVPPVLICMYVCMCVCVYMYLFVFETSGGWVNVKNAIPAAPFAWCTTDPSSLGRTA